MTGELGAAADVADADALSPLIGTAIMGVITAGMYDNPLALYREYIQNAADAAVADGCAVSGTVEIDIDALGRRVRIRDDGPGLSHEAAVRALVPVARSQKRRGLDRGFRGIGRLAGLAFAESVRFTTRARGDGAMTRITWDGHKLRSKYVGAEHLEGGVDEFVQVEIVVGGQAPEQFFEVEIEGIGRHVAGVVLNREAVRSYIGEVCPVPFSTKFPFAAEVGNLLTNEARPLNLNVVIKGEEDSVTRRHGEAILFAKEKEGRYTELEAIRIPALDSERSAAVGWIAHTPYLGAIPKVAGVRGIRARYGNIQIGDESVFDRLFKEDRFNRWCVGEMHVVDPRIVPNGRRDYFEIGPHLRHFENQLGPVVQAVAARCRKASLARNRERKLVEELCRVEDACDLAATGYLAREDAEALAASAMQQAGDVRRNIASSNSDVNAYLGRLNVVESRLGDLQMRPAESVFGDVSGVEVAAYQRAFQALAAVSRSPRAARELIESVLARAQLRA